MEQALDRSKLEQKDRAELATIVEAMGGKATSRAKKADLVEQIMTLAGVQPDGPNGSDAAPAADTGPSLPEPEVVVPDAAVGEDAPAEWEADAPEPAPAAERGGERTQQDDRGRSQGNGLG